MRRTRNNITGGVVLIVIGILFLLNNLIPGFEFGDYWPVMLIAIGIAILYNRRNPNPSNATMPAGEQK